MAGKPRSMVDAVESEEKLLTTKEVAALFDVTIHAVYAWEKKGKLVPHHQEGGRGERRYLESEVQELLRQRKEAESATNDEDAPNIPSRRGGKLPNSGRKPRSEDGNGPYEMLAKARAKNETYRAKLTQIDYQKEVGKLLEAEDVAAVWRGQGQILRDRLMSIPTRVAPVLMRANELRDIENTLKDAITTALEEFSGADSRAN